MKRGWDKLLGGSEGVGWAKSFAGIIMALPAIAAIKLHRAEREQEESLNRPSLE
jgi:hypothetical protein